MHGPSILLDYSEARDSHWTGYVKVAKEILDHPDTALWLDGPLDQDRTQATDKYLSWYGEDAAAKTSFTTSPYTTVPASGSSSSEGSQQFIKPEEPLGNDRGFIHCTHTDCSSDSPPITQELEWTNDMDKNNRPHVRKQRGRENIPYFTRSGGLPRYQCEAPERHRAWTTRMKTKLDKFAKSGGILFWISHITAALSFVLVTNPGQKPNAHPAVDWWVHF